MNRRVLLISAGIAIVVILLGVAGWLLLSDSSSSQQQIIEATPEPIDTGTLPVSSTDPLNPTDLPQPSGAPVAFQGVCPDTWISQTDTDTDGVPDSVEATYGTDENAQDTDGDGYSDSAEIRNGYQPLDSNSSKRLDSDNDGLLDNEECTYRTDAFNPDSDDDGFEDGAEVKSGFDPAKAGDGKGSDKLVAAEKTPGVEEAATPLPAVVTPIPQQGFVTPVPATPAPQQTLSTTPIQISLIPYSQLKTTTSAAAADIKAYLTQVDSLRPQELADGQAIATAIQSAATGNVQPLSQARSRIAQFSAALKGVPTPKPAQEYQQLYVSLIDFTVQQLQAIEQNATGDQAKAAQAVLNIQNTLPSYVTRLSSLRATVEGASNT
ncbi:MAG: hypothetical protein A3C02_01125 [Candidatus Andersenbacteria bacterium RIFCSPHIGHO2_02_FULL_45_11]|uniref:Uncharacterized protein n=1 Tax=Candidatus Andersenbacteria bacterium RIFCSPHIGHO2_12_FULL_45_11 TaxID=1797281 RepID=A0A1G1X1L3_9BACT|nr:MAG: hypothetical protein A2805_04125 [Candidatus Andersenbacteria bacterium RIFCSPHIGHO2_01_FULL_46_36]OGY33584.1 MAG: hypothetical protein A3C02_01125 [Candidatus Andersenbacteria bacterium RIFCSPHIGHO2_02_FULL_45_11]OGY33854.1 MAG: hypothetical protein A3D99_03915 [Candidatus Andersenbacteria bacterium RIFCSPHIGHO2_12_FULL_45_11]